MSDFYANHSALILPALGAALIGAISGSLGTYAVLRKQSLLGDMVSHAALPGIVLAFLLFRSKASLVLVAGALVAGWLATLTMLAIVRASRIKTDPALAAVLAVYFGFGIALLGYTQREVSDARQAGLEHFLFGMAAVIQIEDLMTFATLGGGALVVVTVCWKEFKVLCFDPDFGACLGLPMRLLDVALIGLLVIAIVVGLQTVGVVLMSALLVAPAVAARQWTDRLGRVMVLAGLFGALAGGGGGVLCTLGRVPAGPVIVLCVSFLVGLSLLVAPNHGLLWQWLRRWANRRRLQLEAVLGDLHALAAQHPESAHPHSLAVLRAMGDRTGLEQSLQELARRGLVQAAGPSAWALTPEGRREAERQANERFS